MILNSMFKKNFIHIIIVDVGKDCNSVLLKHMTKVFFPGLVMNEFLRDRR